MRQILWPRSPVLHPYLNFYTRWYSQRTRDKLKRTLDITVALIGITLCIPVFVMVAIVLAAGNGPVFFRQRREGRNGVPFQCLKFRTMVPDAARRLDDLLANDPAARFEWEMHRKLKSDPRVTRLGRFLRKTSVDELPQLFNVLKGDMSLVGPRPIVAAEVPRYGDSISYYYQCRPGLTGPWQIGGRNDVAYGRRVMMDVDYATRRSIRRDLGILARTPVAVLRGIGAS
jgi:lipopolysaccharide/colanic/teichoic acid biosynthesis glycosyltransferase